MPGDADDEATVKVSSSNAVIIAAGGLGNGTGSNGANVGKGGHYQFIYSEWDTGSGKIVQKKAPNIDDPDPSLNVIVAEWITGSNANSVLGSPLDGTYVVNDNVSFNGNVAINNTVRMILKNDYTLTINGAVSGSGALQLCAQEGGSGRFTVNAPSGSSAIALHTFEVDGGRITLNGGDNGSAVAAGNKVQIYGGTVTAAGGSGQGGGIISNGTIEILGGEVMALSKGAGAGIGGLVNSEAITIGETAVVTARGGTGSAGIGAGRAGELDGIILIETGAKVNAYGGSGAYGGGAGIGTSGAASLNGNSNGNTANGSIKIKNADKTRVTARGGAGTENNAGGGAGLGTGGAAGTGTAGGITSWDIDTSNPDAVTSTGGAGHGTGAPGEAQGKGGNTP
jgi:hypothetical protein